VEQGLDNGFLVVALDRGRLSCVICHGIMESRSIMYVDGEIMQFHPVDEKGADFFRAHGSRLFTTGLLPGQRLTE
jgi:hypothetical protein